MADAAGFAKGWNPGGQYGTPTKESDTLKYVTPDEATAGRVHDSQAYGGYGSTAVQGPNGLMVDPNASGQQDAVNRYRGLGAAAANRAGVRGDYGMSQQDMDAGMRARRSQIAGLSMLRGAAAGDAPSRAQIMGSQAAGQGLEAQMAASAGARGPGLAGAAMAAQHGVAGMQLQGMGQYAGMRGNEMAAARGAYGQASDAVRGQDYQQMGMQNQRALSNADAEMQQRQLNQQAQMEYEGLGYAVNQSSMNAGLSNQETDAGIMGNAMKMQEAERQRANARLGAGMSAGGSALGAMSGYSSGGGGQQGGGIIRDNPYGDG